MRAVSQHGLDGNIVMPASERFALHKLVIASRRRSDPPGLLKDHKGAIQTAALEQGLAPTRRVNDIAIAYVATRRAAA